MAAGRARAPAPATGTTAVFGSHVLTLTDDVGAGLSDHRVVVEGDRVAAVTPHRPPGADCVLDRAGTAAVMVDGRLLLEGGRSTTVDEVEVTRAGAAAIHKIWALPEVRAAFAS